MDEKQEIVLPDPVFELYKTEAYISDNYPEPFNNETSFECYIPEGSEGTIFINDMYGRRISEFSITEGLHTLTVNTLDWNSGIYTYGLIVDERIIGYRKMVLTR